MEIIRTFIAVALPEPVRQKLDAVEKQIQSAAGEGARKAVRWVPAANIHLTLKFLGDVSSANIPALADALRSETARHAAFPFTIEGTGAFPNLRRPRVIWAGGQPSAVLTRLQKAVDTATHQLGYPSEDRPFSPHLTVGRVSQHARPEEIALLTRALEEVQIGKIATVPVSEISLYRSDLRPAGPVYTVLQAFPLQPA